MTRIPIESQSCVLAISDLDKNMKLSLFKEASNVTNAGTSGKIIETFWFGRTNDFV